MLPSRQQIVSRFKLNADEQCDILYMRIVNIESIISIVVTFRSSKSAALMRQTDVLSSLLFFLFIRRTNSCFRQRVLGLVCLHLVKSHHWFEWELQVVQDYGHENAKMFLLKCAQMHRFDEVYNIHSIYGNVLRQWWLTLKFVGAEGREIQCES